MGLERAKKHDIPDRLEKENLEFHTEVRTGFLSFAEEDPERFHVINAEEDIEGVYTKSMTEIESTLCLK